MAKKTKDLQYYEGVGRRKEAVARVRLYIGEPDKSILVKGEKVKVGSIVVNGKPYESVFPMVSEQKRFLHPLEITNNIGRFVVSIVLAGGGKYGQLEAIVNGLARALNATDKEAYRPALKEQGLLTRDPRTRERRKVGKGGKARRQKQSPKR